MLSLFLVPLNFLIFILAIVGFWRLRRDWLLYAILYGFTLVKG